MKLTPEARLKRRHRRVRKKVSGTTERPRLFVRRSLKNIYAQVVDDTPAVGARTIASFSTFKKTEAGKHHRNIANAADLGKAIAEDLKNRGIETVVFDRGGYRYHGVVKAVCEAVRENGIKV